MNDVLRLCTSLCAIAAMAGAIIATVMGNDIFAIQFLAWTILLLQIARD